MTIPVFAAERLDTWIFRVSIAIPVVCLAGLVVWYVVSSLAGKLVKKRKPVRLSPEPPSAFRSPKPLPREQALAGAPVDTGQIINDPERLQRTCDALVESLAERYLELANCWLQTGQPQQAAAALQKIVQKCPETRQAAEARDRLRQLEAADNHS
jgi:hypothetical protein